MSSAGLTCHPKKKPKIVSHDVVLYNANGSQVIVSGVLDTLQLYILPESIFCHISICLAGLSLTKSAARGKKSANCFQMAETKTFLLLSFN